MRTPPYRNRTNKPSDDPYSRRLPIATVSPRVSWHDLLADYRAMTGEQPGKGRH